MMDWLVEWWVEKRADIFVGFLIAAVVFLIEEVRGYFSRRKALKHQKSDFNEELTDEIIPAALEMWWKNRQPKQILSPELKAEFAGVAETTAAAWFSGKALVPEKLSGLLKAYGNMPPEFVLTDDQSMEDLKEHKSLDDEDDI